MEKNNVFFINIYEKIINKEEEKNIFIKHVKKI